MVDQGAKCGVSVCHLRVEEDVSKVKNEQPS